MSAHVHGELILRRRGDGSPQGVNGLAIPRSTHHCMEWDRLPSSIRKPGHTALWRHSQENMVCCAPEFLASKTKIATVRYDAMRDINVSATIQSSQTLACPYPDQT